MSQGNGEPPSITPEQFSKAIEELNKSKPDQQALTGLLAPLFTRIYGEALNILEETYPNRERDEAQKKAFAAARTRILRVGNNSRRESETIIADFIVQQVYKREVVSRVVATRYETHGLPRGMTMPTSSHK